MDKCICGANLIQVQEKLLRLCDECLLKHEKEFRKNNNLEDNHAPTDGR